MKFFSIYTTPLLLTALLAFSPPLWAEDIACETPANTEEAAKPSSTPPKSGILVASGQPGLWFPLEDARRVLADLERCKGQTNVLVLTEKRLLAEQEKSRLLEGQLAVSETIAEKLEATVVQQTKQIAAEKKWYNSKALWFIVGIAAGTAATVGITYAVNQ